MAIVASIIDVVIVIDWAAVVPTMMRGPRVADVAGPVVPFRPWGRWLSYLGLCPLVLCWGARIAIVVKHHGADLVGWTGRIGVKAGCTIDDSRVRCPAAAGGVGARLSVCEGLGRGDGRNGEGAVKRAVRNTADPNTQPSREKMGCSGLNRDNVPRANGTAVGLRVDRY